MAVVSDLKYIYYSKIIIHGISCSYTATESGIIKSIVVLCAEIITFIMII